MDAPRVRYVRSGGVHLACCRWGSGEDVVLFAPPLMTNAELVWDLPEWSRALERAGHRCELIHMDKRGIGLSDRVAMPPSIDDHVADMVAVLDAEDVERAVVAGFSEGGMHAVAMAATHPERVKKIVIVGAPAIGVPDDEIVRYLKDGDLPWRDGTEIGAMVERFIETWGTSESEAIARMSPSASRSPHVRAWQERFERQSASPGTVRAYFESMATFDVGPYVASVRCPALIGHALGDLVVHPATARWYADHLADSEHWEWSGNDHAWYFAPNWREVQDRILDFATGSQTTARTSHIRAVLLTDIVDSTQRLADVGDARWRDVLDVHELVARRSVVTHGGRIVKGTGDGFLALFDDPEQAIAATLRMHRELNEAGLTIRAGVHIGQVEERSDGDVAGLAVHIAARVQAHAAPRQLLVSRTVRDVLMAGSQFSFKSVGNRALKGVEGEWELFEVNAVKV